MRFLIFPLFLAQAAFADPYFTKIPIYGGEVDSAALCVSSPSTIYTAGRYGGLWVSRDSGENWQETGFYDTETSGTGAGIVGGATFVAVHSTAPNIVIASQFGSFANKLFRSQNYGQTWSETGNAAIYSQDVNIRGIAASTKNPGTFYLVGNNFSSADGVVYRSVDAGLTWTQTAFISSGKAAWRIAVDVNDILYVAVVDRTPVPDLNAEGLSQGWLYKSTDTGTSWANVKTFDSVPIYLAVSSNTLAVSAANGSKTGLHISTSSAQSFAYKSSSVGPVAVSTDGSKVYRAVDRVYVSSNTGSDWTTPVAISTGALSGVRSSIGASALLIDPMSPNNMYVSDRYQDAFLKSTDTAVTWRVSTRGLGGLIVYDGCKAPGGNIYVLGRTAVFRSTDSGNAWSEVFYAPVQFEKGVIAAPSGNYVFATGQGRVWRSTDSGGSWSDVLTISAYSAEAADKIVFNKPNPAIGYIAFRDANPTGATSRKYIYKTTDYGATWTNLDLTGYSVQALGIDPRDSTIIYAGLGDLHPSQNTQFFSYGGLWRMVDTSTISWSQIAFADKIPYRIVVDSNSMILASCVEQSDPTAYKYNRPTYYSRNGGATWKKVTIKTIGLTSANDIEYSSSKYYLATGDGVYASTNILSSFQLVAHKKDIGDPLCLVVGSMFTGANRGFYRLDWAPAPLTEVIEKPKIYPFPNPFNPGLSEDAVLKYFVPQGQSVDSLQISIYNIAGELVYETSDNSTLAGGNAYYYTWDGTNNSGEPCAEGVYIVVFSSHLNAAKTKAVLVR